MEEDARAPDFAWCSTPTEPWPLLVGEWAEVRTLATGEGPAGPAALETVHARELSSLSRLTDAATFPNLAEVETRRRKLIQAREVTAVMDGADW